MSNPNPIELLRPARRAELDDRCLRDIAGRVFEDLRALTGDGVGISRATYGAGETQAIDYMAQLAEAEGLEVRRDGAANLVIELAGREPDAPCIVCGSSCKASSYSSMAWFVWPNS